MSSPEPGPTAGADRARSASAGSGGADRAVPREWLPVSLLHVAAALNALALAAAANVFFMRPSAALLNEWDEGSALAAARRMLERSDLPYVDAVGHDGPLYYWVVALIEALTGPGTWMPARIVSLGCMLLTVGLGFGAAFVARRSLAGAIMALAYVGTCAVSMDLRSGLAMSAEQLTASLVMGGLLCVALAARTEARRRCLAWLGAAGCLVAMAGLCRPLGWLAAVPLGAWALTLPAGPISRRHQALALGGGLLAPAALVAVGYAAAGQLGTLVYWVRYESQVYTPAVRAASAVHYLHEVVFGHYDLLIVWAALAGWALSSQFARARSLRDLRRAWASRGFDNTVALGALLVLPAVDSSLQVFGKSYLQVLPWAAMLAGILVDRVASRSAAEAAHFPRRTFLVHAIILLPLAALVGMGWQLRVTDYAKDAQSQFESRNWPLCRFLRDHTAPTDSLFIWGYDPAPYVACNRRPASRFVYTTLVAGHVPFVDDPPEVEELRSAPGSHEQLLDDLREANPAVIVDSGPSMMNRSLLRYDFLADFVQERYCRAASYGPTLWTRKPAGGCGLTTDSRPLVLYWNEGRHDCFTAATTDATASAIATHDDKRRVEGAVFLAPQGGLRPLKLFYDPVSGDNFTTATPEGEISAMRSGHLLVRIEGYVFDSPHPGTTELKLFYDPRTRDNCTVATPEGEADAVRMGYVFVRVEGWVPAPNVVPDDEAP